MSFRDVPGQPHAAEFFRRAIRSKRLAHAYILVGPEGIGKHALARAVGQYFFCEAPGEDACGKCRSCRLIASGQFADLRWFARPEGKAQFTVEVIEEFQRVINLKPVESDRKVFILEDSDKLNVSSANKLLKVLEEPPPDSLILLLALDVRDFLPTILSRCHVMRLRPVAIETLTKDLVGSGRCTAAQARYLAAFTMGSPGSSRALATPEFFAERDWLVTAAASLGRADRFAVGEEMLKRAGDADEAQGRRERLLGFFDVLALFYRDALVVALGGDPAAILTEDRAADVRDLAARVDAEAIERILGVLEGAREAVAMNANQKLLIENLAFDIAKLQSP